MSILQTTRPSAHKLTTIKKLIKRREAGEFGYRELAKRVSTILGLADAMSMESCRRLVQELPTFSVQK